MSSGSCKCQTLNSHRQRDFRLFSRTVCLTLFPLPKLLALNSFSFIPFFPPSSVNALFFIRFQLKSWEGIKRNFQFSVEITWRLNYGSWRRSVQSDWIELNEPAYWRRIVDICFWRRDAWIHLLRAKNKATHRNSTTAPVSINIICAWKPDKCYAQQNIPLIFSGRVLSKLENSNFTQFPRRILAPFWCWVYVECACTVFSCVVCVSVCVCTFESQKHNDCNNDNSTHSVCVSWLNPN